MATHYEFGGCNGDDTHGGAEKGFFFLQLARSNVGGSRDEVSPNHDLDSN